MQYILHSCIEDRLYSKAEVARLLGISESGLDRLISEGRWPHGIKIAPQSAPLWEGLTIACELRNAPARKEATGGPQSV